MSNDLLTYPVNEYFLSVQGEGANCGKLSLFLRFGRCNLDCSFCDTKYALKEFQYFSLSKIRNILKKQSTKADLLIITGGEPLLYDLSEVIRIAKQLKYSIAVETNGTLFQDWLKKTDWVTVSPKREGNIKKEVLKLAGELKFVIERKRDFKFVEQFMPFERTYLVPVDNNIEQADMIVRYLKKSKYRSFLKIGIQMQKVYHFK
ncbi:MAG: 7-carboxy-7-deazaguanine synthase QueE [Spirochaetes bacterium]|nr:7-carboxy-7-deazaguanine synthase QueE [Spirochaetota bacterium]